MLKMMNQAALGGLVAFSMAGLPLGAFAEAPCPTAAVRVPCPPAPGHCATMMEMEGHHPEFRTWHHHHHMLSLLTGKEALSDEQLQKLHDLHDQFMDQVAPKMIDLFASKRQMEDLLLQPKVDKAKVMELQARINKIKEEAGNLSAEHRLSVASALTESQRAVLRHAHLRASLGLPPQE